MCTSHASYHSIFQSTSRTLEVDSPQNLCQQREFHLIEEFGLTSTTRTHAPDTGQAISPSELAGSTGGMFCIQWLEKGCVTDIMVQTKNFLPFQPRPRKALGILPIKSGGLTSLSLSSTSATLFPIYLYISIIVKHIIATLFHKPWFFVIF